MPAWFARIFRSTPKLGSMKYAATQVDLHRDMMSSRNARKRRSSSGSSFYSHDATPIRLHLASRNAQFMTPQAQTQVPGSKSQRANSSASQYMRTRSTSAPAPPGLPRSRYDTMPPVPSLSSAPKRLPPLPPLMQPTVQPFLTRTPARRGAGDWLPLKKCRVCEFDNPVTDHAGPDIPCTHVHLGFPCHGTYRVTERDVVKRRELLKQLEYQSQPRFG